MNIAVLITCHNRKETTLRCLESLLAATQGIRVRGLGIRVFLVDDGSTDGTGESVRQWAQGIREQGLGIRVVDGSGSLYWAKGMALAWREALKYESSNRHSPNPQSLIPTPFDAFLWLNDDTILRPDAISRAVQCLRAAGASAPTRAERDEGKTSAVVVGSLIDEASGRKTCGLKGEGLFTGNFVLVPRVVFEKVGMICGEYRHAWADSDYAMRCRKAGVKVVELEDVGTTRAHDFRPSLRGWSLWRRWNSLFDPKGWCVHDLWLYRRRNWGLSAAVCSCAHLVLHVVLGER